MGEEASARMRAAASQDDALQAFNEYFYDELGFTGNREQYDDPRNSFLNEVLDRRTGIPISLAVVYMEVARRAGMKIAGINFPGHFLIRAPPARATRGRNLVRPSLRTSTSSIRFTAARGCRKWIAASCCRQHVGDDAAFDETLLAAGHAARHGRADAGQPQAALRAHAIVSAGAVHVGSAAVGRSDGDHGAPRSRAARVSPAGLRRCTAGSGSLPAARSRSTRRRPPELEDEDTDESNAESENAQIWEHVKTLGASGGLQPELVR